MSEVVTCGRNFVWLRTGILVVKPTADEILRVIEDLHLRYPSVYRLFVSAALRGKAVTAPFALEVLQSMEASVPLLYCNGKATIAVRSVLKAMSLAVSGGEPGNPYVIV